MPTPDPFTQMKRFMPTSRRPVIVNSRGFLASLRLRLAFPRAKIITRLPKDDSFVDLLVCGALFQIPREERIGLLYTDFNLTQMTSRAFLGNRVYLDTKNHHFSFVSMHGKNAEWFGILFVNRAVKGAA